MKRISKRDELIRVGRDIIVRQGFKSASLNNILTKAGVPKGSFYYYFSSKEDFGLAIVEDFANEYRHRFKTILGDEKYSPLTRLRNYFELKIADMDACRCNDGCLIGNLAQELSAQNELFRDRLSGVFAEWEQYFFQCLQAADEAGEIESDRGFFRGLTTCGGASTVQPHRVPKDSASQRHRYLEELAKFIVFSWEGAILQAKVTKSVLPMQIFVKILFEQILPISNLG